jgi:hypothetical protein
MLRHEGLAAFSADDFLHEAAEFANGWNDPARRRGLMDGLGRLAEQHVLRAFSQSISLSDYDAVNAHYEFSRGAAGPYGVCAALLMTSVRQWMAAKHPDDLTLFVFEQGDIDQRELRRILRGAGADGEPAQMWPRQWRDERGRHRYLRPLEACELFPADQDGVFLKRLTERSLLEARSMDREELVQICHALAILPRSAIEPDDNAIRLGTR